jgi:uncharacterized protein YdbL (DUF1318 family)
MLATALTACIIAPVTVHISFPQETLDWAAEEIEDLPAQSAEAPPAASTPAPTGDRSRSLDLPPRIDTRSPEITKLVESRRQRRPALREWKSRGCIGETNEGVLAPRPGDGCGPEVAVLIRAENADRQVLYAAFMKVNKIPPSDTTRVLKAFDKTHDERARPDDWIQLDDAQWVRKR